MRPRAGLVVLLAACLVGGASCQARREPPATSAPAPDALDLARAAVGRRDHATAVSLLRDVLPSRPDSLEAHYLLAVSASHLDQHEEASREFRWVVAHGEPGAAEVAIAREWLASRVTSATPAAVPPPSPAAVDGAPGQEPELASLSGRALDAAGSKPRLLLFLKGSPGSAVQDRSHTVRTDASGRFHFSNVVPGDYVLTDAVAGPATWRLRMTLAGAERRVVDLSPANSTRVRGERAGAAR
jgi:hypothetical protein